MLTAAQWRCQAVRGDGGHSVGHWYAALLELLVQVHDHGSLLLLLLLRGVMLLVMVVMVVSGRVQ